MPPNTFYPDAMESIPILSEAAYSKLFPSHHKPTDNHWSSLVRPIVDGLLQMLQRTQPGHHHHVCIADLETGQLLYSDPWFSLFVGSWSGSSELEYQQVQRSVMARAFRPYPTGAIGALLPKISLAWEKGASAGKTGCLSIYHHLISENGISCPVVTQCQLAPLIMEETGAILIAHVTEVRHLAQHTGEAVLGASLRFADGSAHHWHLDMLSSTLVDKPILSSTEIKVLNMIAEGHSSRHIADLLNTSPSTADTHRRNICRKLSCVDTTAAVQLCLLMGWI